MVQFTGKGGELFYEPHFGIFFRSSMLAVLEAEYTLNRDFTLQQHDATLEHFYNLLHIKPPLGASEVGWPEEYLIDEWTIDWIDFVHRPAIDDQRRPYICIDYPMEPVSFEEKINW